MRRSPRSSLIAGAFALALFVSLVLAPRSAHAYPWMIRHGHINCTTCHADPSGEGLLTKYGRAQSEILLSSHYGKAPKKGEEEEPSRFSQELFGIVHVPDFLLLGGWVRGGYIWNSVDGRLVDHRILQMRYDLAAQITFHRFRAYGSLGYASPDSALLSQQAWVTSNRTGAHLVSREHWLGWDATDAILLRAGRINLPFGIRNIEHNAWVRSETRTDINQNQQHGVAIAYNDEHVRAEAMAIAGNYQVSPDAYRDRGASAYAELRLGQGQAAGVSLLVTHAAADLATRTDTLRQAHGLFARLSKDRLAVLAEADLLLTYVKGPGTHSGFVGWLQGDYEIVKGVHGLLTFETLRRPEVGADWGWGVWASAAWYFLPHFDVRGDVVRRMGLGASPIMTYLLQLNWYL